MSGYALTPPVGHIALIGNFPPRRCGIATFTADLRNALAQVAPDTTLTTIAMNDPGMRHLYPAEVGYEIAQDDAGAYLAAADHLNALNPDVVCVQHEFGIFGGDAGSYLLPMLERLRAPIVTTLHTILTRPNPAQKRAMEALVERSSRLVAMTEMGRTILTRDMGLADSKISVIPHGIPDVPFLDPAFHKHRFGLDGRRVILTFGLLSPNKGIEVMIDGLSRLVKDHPDLVYVVLGATHPHLVAREGERYRDQLEARVRDLGLANHVRFVNEYVDAPTLQAWLSACDIYVTPYLSEAQITSGTLAYAVGLGKAVISTPYWHAQELLADRRGQLVPFASPEALAGAIGAVLSDRSLCDELRRNAYQAGREMIWPVVAERYTTLFQRARVEACSKQDLVQLNPSKATPPEPSFTAVARMSDGCGMLQHSRSTVPDRRHGYCLDDNARALMLAAMFEAEGIDSKRAMMLAPTYASFVDLAWDEQSKRFRNFMGFDRQWLEHEGSQDSFGRALWAIGRTAELTRHHGLKLWATALADKVIPASAYLTSPRARAFAILGLAAHLRVYPGLRAARLQLEAFAEEMLGLLRAGRRSGWTWFEPVLAYDNARLPEALLLASIVLDDGDMRREALEALDWLRRQQTAPEGHFRPVGTQSFGAEYQAPRAFDQQPLEAWATIDACALAFEQDGDRHWQEHAEAAFAWYLGSNDLGLRIASLDGGCYDGLQADRVNLNQGAESILAYQFAALTIGRVRRAAELSEKGEASQAAVTGGAACR
ncbi:glycosyltransferase family 4 protein [Sphingomonas beigongshangi]|uniref:glycosyltransferase family 4 protein n=1 Tax=Sphingomonas beigongshangi TaxID=2782540 RepID=UPI001AEDE3FF|nr:glycosyltransferase family 4 protein [Sphingomonas beigongshangi]